MMKNKKNMKKALSLMLAGAMLAGTSLPTMAAGGFNPPAQADTEVEFNTDEQTSAEQKTPVYGYVGPDAVLVDPDPDDPDVKPIPELPEDFSSQINVSVPVKILWAVYEDTDGEVVSPSYYVRNNSEDLSVSVEAMSFAARNYEDNVYVDSHWTRNLSITPITTATNIPMLRGMGLNDSARTLVGNLKQNEQIDFEVTGKLDYNAVDLQYYTANGASLATDPYDNALQPEYDLVLRISALTNN